MVNRPASLVSFLIQWWDTELSSAALACCPESLQILQKGVGLLEKHCVCRFSCFMLDIRLITIFKTFADVLFYCVDVSWRTGFITASSCSAFTAQWGQENTALSSKIIDFYRHQQCLLHLFCLIMSENGCVLPEQRCLTSPHLRFIPAHVTESVWWASSTPSGDIQIQASVSLLIKHRGCWAPATDLLWGSWWCSALPGRISSTHGSVLPLCWHL